MGETPIRAIAESRSWRSQLYWIGVWPDGAHVRRRTGCSMKPLSSEKISGLRSRFALFLFAATRVCASARWPLRCVPVLDARVSDMSNRVREESSIHAPNDIRRRMSWRLPPQHGDRSIGPFGSRPFVGLSARLSPIAASVSCSDVTGGHDEPWLSMPPILLSVRPDANAAPTTRKPRQSSLPLGPFGQPPTTSLLGVGGPPVRSSFLSFS